MTEIGAYDAKTHLPKLLERARRGERIIITRHGQPIAELGPVAASEARDRRQAVLRFKALRDRLRKKGVRLGDVLEEGESLRDLAHVGHRY